MTKTEAKLQLQKSEEMSEQLKMIVLTVFQRDMITGKHS